MRLAAALFAAAGALALSSEDVSTALCDAEDCDVEEMHWTCGVPTEVDYEEYPGAGELLSGAYYVRDFVYCDVLLQAPVAVNCSTSRALLFLDTQLEEDMPWNQTSATTCEITFNYYGAYRPQDPGDYTFVAAMRGLGANTTLSFARRIVTSASLVAVGQETSVAHYVATVRFELLPTWTDPCFAFPETFEDTRGRVWVRKSLESFCDTQDLGAVYEHSGVDYDSVVDDGVDYELQTFAVDGADFDAFVVVVRVPKVPQPSIAAAPTVSAVGSQALAPGVVVGITAGSAVVVAFVVVGVARLCSPKKKYEVWLSDPR